jgi:hypothetical protein
MHAKFEDEGIWNLLVQERYFIVPKNGEPLWEFYVIAGNTDSNIQFGFVPTEGRKGSWMLYSYSDIKYIAKQFGNEGCVHDLDFTPIKFSLLVNKLNNGTQT